MIVTTTNTIDGHTIREYCGIVFGEVITGVNMFRDIGANNGMLMVSASGTAVVCN